MNLGLLGLFTFWFLVPGIIFRRFYFTEAFSNEYFKSSFYIVIITAFFPSLIFQVGFYYLANIIGFNINCNLLIGFLTNHSKNDPQLFLNYFSTNQSFLFFYFTIMWLSAMLIGNFCQKIVRIAKWDRKFKFLRYGNKWHYIFTGEIFDFKRFNISLTDKTEDIEFCFLEILTETKEGSVLYDGILTDYELSKNSDLENIYLNGVKRRLLNFSNNEPENNKKTKTFEVRGDFMIIPYHNVLNINCTYYKLKDLTADGTYDICRVN